MRNLLYIFLALVFNLCIAAEISCAGKQLGFHCINDSQYAWCYGLPNATIMPCPSTLVCPCGYTTASPCIWPGTKPSPCTGEPGDILGPVVPSSSSSIPPIESSSIPPVESSSIPPVESSSIPPVESSSIPPVESSSIPPIESSSIPPIESSSIPPIESSSIPPIESSSIPPIESSSITPVESSSITPVESSSIPPVESSSIPPVDSSSTIIESSDSSEVPVAEPPEIAVPTEMMASAYFTNWPQYHTGTLDGYSCQFVPSNINASHLTHIFYAFAVFDETFKVKNFEWNDYDFYAEVQAKKKAYPHLKTLISIGGWNFNLFDSTKHLFSLMASKQSYRKIFIESAIDYAHKHGFDGIDIDWEYPGHADQGGQPRDTENFTKLLREMRVAINQDTRSPKLLFSIAAPAGEEKINLIQINKIHKYLNWINLMAYDYHGSWDKEVGPHTALKGAFSTLNTEHATDLYLKAGVPSKKMILGLAAYGRTWNLAKSGVSASYGTAANGAGKAGVCTQEDGFLASFEIAHMIKQGATSVAHEPTDTVFAYNNDQFVTYDTVDTHTKKINYACSKRFGGAFMWAMDLDTNYQMINNMYDRVKSQSCKDGEVEDSSSSYVPGTCEDKCLVEYKVCNSKLQSPSDACNCITKWGKCLADGGCAKMDDVKAAMNAYKCAECAVPTPQELQKL